MALTQLQASDQYIIDSFAAFLDRNIKTAYDAQVAGMTTDTLDISKALKIAQGKPSDRSIALDPPTIGIEDVNAGQGFVPNQIGANTGFRQMNLSLYCFPAINAIGGEPSNVAAALLKSYFRNVLSTVAIKIKDYSNPDYSPSNILYCDDPLWVVKFTPPMNRGKNNPSATERNRFDINVSLQYEVAETLVS